MYPWNRKRAVNSDMCHKSRAPLAVRIFYAKERCQIQKKNEPDYNTELIRIQLNI